MELVYEALRAHLRDGHGLTAPVSPKTQTEAAHDVGRKTIHELEGVSTYGARLARLTLALGRLFGKLAEQPLGSAPEYNEFEVGAAVGEEALEVDALLTAAVQHLALERLPGTKLLSPFEVKDYDFRPHPIFAPLFAFSHRKKRKLLIDPSNFLLLSLDPTRGVEAVYRARGLTNVAAVAVDDLPDQLSFLGDTLASS